MRKKCTSGLYEAEAVALSMTFPDDAHVSQILISFSAAPTTSENLTITLDSAQGSDYDVELLSVDPVAEGAESALTFEFTAEEMNFVNGDGLDIAYTNTDDGDIAVSVYYEVP